MATLVGRPVAVVRAEVRLEVVSDAAMPGLTAAQAAARAAAYASLAQQTFEVRLGALTRFQDGLLGYFVDDDYRRYFPVHSSVPKEALPAAPHTGFLGPADSAGLPAGQPVDHPYVEPDPTITVHPGQTVRLTLLMDPGGEVHVTSGVVPRKSVSLLRDWTDTALARITPSFRVGPVLVDPTTVSMPKATGLPTDQLWSYRDAPTTWQDRQIMAATKEAILPERGPVAQEGYVRARRESDGA
jgi:hypothetical protein